MCCALGQPKASAHGGRQLVVSQKPTTAIDILYGLNIVETCWSTDLGIKQRKVVKKRCNDIVLYECLWLRMTRECI